MPKHKKFKGDTNTMKIKIQPTYEDIIAELPTKNCVITYTGNTIEITGLSLEDETTFKNKIIDKVHKIE